MAECNLETAGRTNKMLDMKPNIFFHTVLNMINTESKNHNNILPTYKKALQLSFGPWCTGIHKCGSVVVK